MRKAGGMAAIAGDEEETVLLLPSHQSEDEIAVDSDGEDVCFVADRWRLERRRENHRFRGGAASVVRADVGQFDASVSDGATEDDDDEATGGAAIMDFDDVLEELGEFGRFQAVNYLLICLPVLFGAANSLSYVFTAAVPDYRCFVPGCDDAVNPQYDAPWVRRAVPSGADNDSAYRPAQCLRYDANASAGCPQDFSGQAVSCDAWVFKDHERTIVGEWNITCLDQQWKLSLVGTVHFAGILFGSLLFGYLADRFGRKLVFISCILLMSVSGVAQALSTDYITFQVFVLINALGTSGVYPLAFIIGVELVGKRKREMSGMVLNYFYAVGEACVGLVAWLTKDWVVLQLAVSAPPAVFVLYYWFVPESVRWLIVKRQTRRAGSIIKRAAEVNGVVLSESLLSSIGDQQDSSKKKAGDTLESVWKICKSRKLLLRAINLIFNWAANAFVYYGLSLNSVSLSGNKYLNFALVCLVEIPGYSLSWVAMNKLGRRWALGGSLLVCGVTCLGAAFVPNDLSWAVIVLFLIGKLGVTSSFGVLYVFTAELYPTAMRSVGVGTSSTISRFGAMVAPFTPLLGVYFKSLPLLIFGTVSFAAGLFALLLPETLGRKLPDTVEELEELS